MILEAILVRPQRPILPIDLTRVDFFVANAAEVTAATPASADTTESELTINFNIKGLVTLIHFARQRRIEDFQKKPYVSLLKMYGARYFLTSFLETLHKNNVMKIIKLYILLSLIKLRWIC
jgi:NADP-dependent 3-hydroxy acid dehydrogenase YdfG